MIGEELLPQKRQRWERVSGRILETVAAQPACAEDVAHLAKIYCPGVALNEARTAGRLGRSAALVNQVLKARYKGDLSGVEARVRGIMGHAIQLSEQLGRVKRHTFADIGSFEAILAQEYDARLQPTFKPPWWRHAPPCPTRTTCTPCRWSWPG